MPLCEMQGRLVLTRSMTRAAPASAAPPTLEVPPTCPATEGLCVVALCGGMRSGKDTAAAHLVRAHAFVHVKLAQQLKDGLCAFFGFTAEQVEGGMKDRVDPRWGVTPRSVMQWMGTDVMQHHLSRDLLPHMGRTFWARQLAHRIAGMHAQPGGPSRFVISDMRFLHEHACLSEALGTGFMAVRIIRPDAMSRGSTPDALHISEQEWAAIPARATLVNNADIPTLHARVDGALRLKTITEGRTQRPITVCTPGTL